MILRRCHAAMWVADETGCYETGKIKCLTFLSNPKERATNAAQSALRARITANSYTAPIELLPLLVTGRKYSLLSSGPYRICLSDALVLSHVVKCLRSHSLCSRAKVGGLWSTSFFSHSTMR